MWSCFSFAVFFINHSPLFLLLLLLLPLPVEAFTKLDDVYRECRDVLKATGLLALIVWVGGATLFYVFEHHHHEQSDAFYNLPDSLYFTAVFLGGEWGRVDFTVGGKIVCILLCVLGVALFGV